MSIDFSKVTAITTPSGALSSIKRTSDLVQLWPTVKSKDFSYMYIGMNCDNQATNNHWTVSKHNETNIVKNYNYIGTYIKDNKLYEKYPYAVLLTGMATGDQTSAQMTDDTMLPMPKLVKTGSEYECEIELNECINGEAISSSMARYKLGLLATSYTELDYTYFTGYQLGLGTYESVNVNHFVDSSTIDYVGLIMNLPTDDNINGWSQNVLTYQSTLLPYIGCSNQESKKHLNIPMTLLMVTKDFYEALKEGSKGEHSVEISNILITISGEMHTLWYSHTKPTSANWVEIE